MEDERQREVLLRFFKTGKGEYGEGDRFLGIRVPEVRLVAKTAVELPLEEVPTLLLSPWHEVRLCGLLILTYQMERLCRQRLLDEPKALNLLLFRLFFIYIVSGSLFLFISHLCVF
ncbi:MAG: DNA alkylation repair protein, partial [Paludibacteraceae bacterium]|nr:DNA alkylation repair protein [Paludibacteraceae bacterium]